MLTVFRRSGCPVESRLVDGANEVQILFDEPPATEPGAARPARARPRPVKAAAKPRARPR